MASGWGAMQKRGGVPGNCSCQETLTSALGFFENTSISDSEWISTKLLIARCHINHYMRCLMTWEGSCVSTKRTVMSAESQPGKFQLNWHLTKLQLRRAETCRVTDPHTFRGRCVNTLTDCNKDETIIHFLTLILAYTRSLFSVSHTHSLMHADALTSLGACLQLAGDKGGGGGAGSKGETSPPMDLDKKLTKQKKHRQRKSDVRSHAYNTD